MSTDHGGLTRASSVKRRIVSKRATSLAALRMVNFIGNLVLDEHYDSGVIAKHPGDDLPRVLRAFRFDNRPRRMDSAIASPFELMQVACGMNFFDGSVAFLNRVWRFN
jgi:hypothetical protein